MSSSGPSSRDPGSASEPPVVIRLYDPPMCCPGGLCGPVVDPALLAINEACLAVSKRYGNQVTIVRYLLGQQAGEFMRSPEVLTRLKEHGTAVLPITMVNGSVVRERVYPTLEELIELVDAEIRRCSEGK